MRLTHNATLGLPIRERLGKNLLGRVAALVVHPDNGQILAVYASRNHHLIVPTVDIIRASREEFWIEDHEALCPPADIVRIHDIINERIPIIGNRVFTVGRQFLGTVLDYEFETNGWVLTQLSVGKRILTVATERKLIDARQIVRISAKEITVNDATIAVTAPAASGALANTEIEPTASFQINRK